MKKIISLLVLLTGVLLLGACGGGSSGGDGDDSGDSVTYSGSTEQAVVTEDNGQELVAAALSAGMSASVGTTTTASVATGSAEGSSASQVLNPLVALVSDLQSVTIDDDGSDNGSAAVYSHNRTVDGDCGGTRTVGLSYDDEGIFSATVAYNEYCDNGVTIDGDAEFSGTLNVATEQYVTYVVVCDDLSLATESVAYTLHGSIETDVTTSGFDLLMNLDLLDETEDRVYRIENYDYSIAFGDSVYSYSINGRFYHPDYGYVSLETTETFYVNNEEDYPYSGQLVVTGASSSAVRLTALSSAECQVDIDVNGDGEYDISSGPIPWTSL